MIGQSEKLPVAPESQPASACTGEPISEAEKLEAVRKMEANPTTAALFERLRASEAVRAGLNPATATIEESLNVRRQQQARAHGLNPDTATWRDVLGATALPYALSREPQDIENILTGVQTLQSPKSINSFLCWVAGNAVRLEQEGRSADARHLLNIWGKVNAIKHVLNTRLGGRS